MGNFVRTVADGVPPEALQSGGSQQSLSLSLLSNPPKDTEVFGSSRDYSWGWGETATSIGLSPSPA